MFFVILMIVAMILTLVSLLGGLFVMVKGGETNTKYGNKFMQWRVYMQGAAIACFVIAFLLMDKA